MTRVVAAVIIAPDRAGPARVLACRRTHPPALAGLWEFPGGKVEAGESDHEALLREIAEELQVTVELHAALGEPLPMVGAAGEWQPYLATIVAGEPRLVDHDELRWLAADELHDVAWLASDVPVMSDVARILHRATAGSWPEEPPT